MGVWVVDRVGACHLTHYGDGDNDPVVVLHGGGHPCPWARRLMPILRQRACSWVWVGVHARSHLCDDDVVVVTSVVGEGRGPEWGPVGDPG